MAEIEEKFSVVIPCTHSDLSHVKILVRDLENQTQLPLEVIISLSEVKESSALQLHRELSPSFNLIISHTPEKLSVGTNKNRGVELSSASYIIFLNPRDLYHSQKIEITSKLIQKYNPNLILHSYHYEVSPSSLDTEIEKLHVTTSDNLHLATFGSPPVNTDEKGTLNSPFPIHHAATTVKKSVFDKFKYSDLEYGEDSKFCREVLWNLGGVIATNVQLMIINPKRTPKIKLFNLDLHISVIADVINLFENYYPNQFDITNWSISGHNWILGKETAIVEHVNQNTWRSISPEMIKNFQSRYDSFLSTFDGFIVTHSPVFCMLFEKYNKPILMVNSCRYEQPFCWSQDFKMWTQLDSCLKKLNESKLLIPISNNKADRDYLLVATGIKSTLIPSLCLYTESSYGGKIPLLLVFDSNKIIPSLRGTISKAKGLKSGYTWKDLYSYKAIIHVPYEISTMSIFEQYSANVPLLFPAKTLLKKWIQEKKIEFYGPYIKENYPPHLKSVLGPDWVDFWLDRADYYDQSSMPHIILFESLEHLAKLISSVNFDQISEKMKQWNKIRIERNKENWTQILKPLRKE